MADIRTRTRRLTPALSIHHLPDSSGGTVVDALQPVNAFADANGDLASAVSARLAFQRVFHGVCEIMARVSPVVCVPHDIQSEIAEIGEVVAGDVGMTIIEANEYRVALNGYIATAHHYTCKFAASKGVEVQHSSLVAGDHFVSNWALAALNVDEQNPSIPGLSKAEADAALRCWADHLATLASVVNAAPAPTEFPINTVEQPADETDELPEEPAHSEQ